MAAHTVYIGAEPFTFGVMPAAPSRSQGASIAGIKRMTRRLGTATVDLRGERVVFVLFNDGRATCEHVAAGALSVSSRHGHLSARKHQAEPFTIHRCASCHRRFGP